VCRTLLVEVVFGEGDGLEGHQLHQTRLHTHTHPIHRTLALTARHTGESGFLDITIVCTSVSIYVYLDHYDTIYISLCPYWSGEGLRTSPGCAVEPLPLRARGELMEHEDEWWWW
jgi:hypothetical protein